MKNFSKIESDKTMRHLIPIETNPKFAGIAAEHVLHARDPYAAPEVQYMDEDKLSTPNTKRHNRR